MRSISSTRACNRTGSRRTSPTSSGSCTRWWMRQSRLTPSRRARSPTVRHQQDRLRPPAPGVRAQPEEKHHGAEPARGHRATAAKTAAAEPAAHRLPAALRTDRRRVQPGEGPGDHRETFEALFTLVQELDEEEHRAVREGWTKSRWPSSTCSRNRSLPAYIPRLSDSALALFLSHHLGTTTRSILR
jgi:hypothetical protein